MKAIVATQEPHLKSAVSGDFEKAPYFLVVDTITCRTADFPHPIQYLVECTPAGLVHRIHELAPDIVIAGSFSEQAREALQALKLVFALASGRVCDAIERCSAVEAGPPLPRGGEMRAHRHSAKAYFG